MRMVENALPDLTQLIELYRAVGWLQCHDDEKFVKNILLNTDEFICIYIGNTLAAFGRMLTDYHMSAFLDDIVVHPGFRKMGLGSAVVNHLISKAPEVKKVKLTTFHASEFYKKLGFTNPSCTPMEWILNP